MNLKNSPSLARAMQLQGAKWESDFPSVTTKHLASIADINDMHNLAQGQYFFTRR